MSINKGNAKLTKDKTEVQHKYVLLALQSNTKNSENSKR